MVSNHGKKTFLDQNYFYMDGKLVKTSVGCVGVSKETVVNLEINWYTVWLTSETSVLYSQPHGVPIYF